MSSGSYFLILEDTKEIINKDIIDSYLDKIVKKDYDLFSKFSKEDRISNLQDTQPIPDQEETFYYFSISSRSKWIKLADFDFGSDFICLKNHFDMNPYSKCGELEISEFDAYKMLEILNYIKAQEYWSHFIEEFILDRNEYLQVFDLLDINFYNRFQNNKDIEWSPNSDEIYTFSKLKDCLSTFLSIKNSSDESNIKLIYKTW